jgi:hypothetical protein
MRHSTAISNTTTTTPMPPPLNPQHHPHCQAGVGDPIQYMQAIGMPLMDISRMLASAQQEEPEGSALPPDHAVYLATLPSITMQEDHTDDPCSICIDVMRSGQSLCELSCNHLFHHACVVQWLEKNNTCPKCRDVALPLREEPRDDSPVEVSKMPAVSSVSASVPPPALAN